MASNNHPKYSNMARILETSNLDQLLKIYFQLMELELTNSKSVEFQKATDMVENKIKQYKTQLA